MDAIRPKLILIRGIPGSGKTTYAKTLGIKDHYEADQWFENNGGYNPTKIKQAHEWCQTQTFMAMKANRDVVVSNTFCRVWEMQSYIDMAKQTDHEVIIKTMTGEYQNIHGVPDEKVIQMKNRFEAETLANRMEAKL
jgi:predicted kinase